VTTTTQNESGAFSPVASSTLFDSTRNNIVPPAPPPPPAYSDLHASPRRSTRKNMTAQPKQAWQGQQHSSPIGRDDVHGNLAPRKNSPSQLEVGALDTGSVTMPHEHNLLQQQQHLDETDQTEALLEQQISTLDAELERRAVAAAVAEPETTRVVDETHQLPLSPSNQHNADNLLHSHPRTHPSPSSSSSTSTGVGGLSQADVERMCHSYEDTIDSLENQIRRLRSQLTSLELKNSKPPPELDDDDEELPRPPPPRSEGQWRALEGAHRKLQEEYSRLHSLASEDARGQRRANLLSKLNHQLQNALKSSQKKISLHTREVGQLQQQLDQAHLESEELRNLVAELESARQLEVKTSDTLRKQLEAMKAENVQLATTLFGLKRQAIMKEVHDLQRKQKLHQHHLRPGRRVTMIHDRMNSTPSMPASTKHGIILPSDAQSDIEPYFNEIDHELNELKSLLTQQFHQAQLISSMGDSSTMAHPPPPCSSSSQVSLSHAMRRALELLDSTNGHMDRVRRSTDQLAKNERSLLLLVMKLQEKQEAAETSRTSRLNTKQL